MVGWTWHFPSAVEINTVPIWEDNIKIYVEHDDCIYLAPDKFNSENAMNTLLGDVFYVVVQNINSLKPTACRLIHVAYSE
jgi:hypothetical protein